MTKGSIGLNAGAIWNLLSDGQHWSFEALRAKSALTDADLWSAIGWLARENKIEIDNTSSHPIFCPFLDTTYVDTRRRSFRHPASICRRF